MDGLGWMEELLIDAGFGVRVLRRNPVFASVAVLTLVLGIGASTSIFSLVDGILLRPLPYPEPQALVTVWADLSELDGPRQEWLSYPNYEDARDSGAFEELGAYLEGQWTLTGEGPTQVVQGLRVSRGTISSVLRAEPALGRTFLPEEDAVGGAGVVLISDGLWNRIFGGNPEILERDLILDGNPYRVVGVMPPGFTVPNLGGSFSALVQHQDVWLPLQARGDPELGGRGSAIFRTVGRLRSGVSQEAARSRLTQLGERLQEAYPEENTGVGFSVFPLRKDMVQAQETGLWILLGAVGFILLLVCLNLANLVLARGSGRLGEMALRSALGAERRRLVRQLVTESMVMAALGGALGIGLAFVGTRLLVSLAPAGTPRLDSVTMDGRILVFAGSVTLISGILFGLFPALRVSRGDLRENLAQGTRTTEGKGAIRFRWAMAGGQMAVAMILLVGAGLLLRTFRELTRVDLGYEPRGVVSAFIGLNGDRYESAESRSGFVAELEDRIGAIPGVERVGVISSLPLSGLNEDVEFLVEGRPPPFPGQENISWIRRVTPGYFEAMGIPILEGRGFTRGDDREGESRVVVVNETLARRFFPGESAVGKRLNFNDPANPVWREIVGVARNVKNFGIRTESPNATYFPYAQVPGRALFVAVRAGFDDPSSLAPSIRSILSEMDPTLALARPAAMEDLVAGALAQDRFVAFLLSLFALVAVTLAAVGLYGVVAYNVSRRQPELGLRMALGADGGRIRRAVVGQGLLVAGSGVLAGVLGALALTHLLGRLLFGVEPADPLTFTLTSVGLVGVSAAASFIPALRASRVDPARILKTD